MLQVLRAQLRSHPPGLRGLVGERQHLDLPARRLGGAGAPVRPQRPGSDRRQPEPTGHPADGLHERPGAPMDRSQRDRLTAEQAAELGDRARMRPAERVDRRVGVGEGDQGRPLAHQGADQPQLGRIELGELVDVHRAELATHGLAHLHPGQQDAHPVHQLGVVEDALGVQHVEVLLHELAQRLPARLAGLGGEGRHVGRIQPQLPDTRQRAPRLTGERTRAHRLRQRLRPRLRATPGEQLRDAEFLLGRGQEPRDGVQALAEVRQDGQAERVQGRGPRLEPTSARPDHPVAHLGRRLSRQAQRQPRRLARPDAPRHQLDQQRGLPGAGGPQHQQRARVVPQDPALRLAPRPARHDEDSTTGLRQFLGRAPLPVLVVRRGQV